MPMTTTPSPLRVRFFQCAGALVATAALLAGCAGMAKTVPAPSERTTQSVSFDGPISDAEQMRIAAAQARVAAKLASGYVYKTTGTATAAVVRADGTSTIWVGRGHFLRISLVPNGERGDRISFDGSAGRNPQFLPPTCIGGCGFDGGGSSPTPDPGPPPPPNYDGCRAAGGATWFDKSTGSGGCLGPGASRGMTCGTWSYSRPGKGKFTFASGGGSMDGVDWISDNGDGSCGLG
jgi:hypothetical protein